ncbi:MAG: hypothetical protein ACRDKE_08460, partial [Solirubrobacterales bacterium]
MRSLIVILLGAITCGLSASSAIAAPPPANDNRAAAQQFAPGQDMAGTLVGATLEADELTSKCESTSPAPIRSVWYRFVGTGGQLALGFEAAGVSWGTIDVLSADSSPTTPIYCDRFSHNELLTTSFRSTANAVYFVRIAAGISGPMAPFLLRLLPDFGPAGMPGKPLPAGGAIDSITKVGNPSDLWSVNLKAHVTYRLKLDVLVDDGSCMTAKLTGPRDRRLIHPRIALRCFDGYALFTPKRGEGGMHTFRVYGDTGGDRRTIRTQRYRLRVALAKQNDLPRGVLWTGGVKRGQLNYWGMNIEDIYRLKLKRPSKVAIDLKTDS